MKKINTIHIYEKSGGSNILVNKLEFSKSASGSPYTDTSYTAKKGGNILKKFGKIKTRKESCARIQLRISLTYPIKQVNV
ncbi:hypothetical protein [Peribacillus sp. NPDC058075]|uniref:hypothetical protein n=1 Tax=unclassified Peribacillus TaxID=2675266 RepID=UPI0036DCACDF